MNVQGTNTRGFSPLKNLPGWNVKHFTGVEEQEHRFDCNGDGDAEIFSVELEGRGAQSHYDLVITNGNTGVSLVTEFL